jgi:hypothetical protein
MKLVDIFIAVETGTNEIDERGQGPLFYSNNAKDPFY